MKHAAILLVLVTFVLFAWACGEEVCNCPLGPTGPGWCPAGDDVPGCGCIYYRLCPGWCQPDDEANPVPCDGGTEGGGGGGADGG